MNDVINELDENELLALISKGDRPLAVFLESPFCGTCKVAKRMLEVACRLIPEEIQVVSGNINMLPELVYRYRISSIPALLIFNRDRSILPGVYYRFHSVETVLAYIRSVNSS
ncbi:thioredoxin family protein [Paenibacillus sp. HN-1]|uniref:thioredoxin family protein n=1 Tax=Paenibacillus TaxID=44249 RepID=UPI001CA7CAB5|nr:MULTISPECIES: thioredoxin family protein [Paenibacillus]MBY9082048.1 thioredoxin family protein [Paenibacillus sp. CGMCC 1.18879]MBY9085794.1 thioredoxin family protein [Paenibacillus sinensis]